MNNKIRKQVGLVIVLIGITIFTFPYFRISVSDLLTNSRIEKFESNINRLTKEDIAEIENVAMNYNSNLTPDASAVVDPFDVEDYRTEDPLKDFDLTNEVGYIYIPTIGEKLPLYLGATDDNLAKGVAQVDGTAIPIGEVGQRPVIAGHRGYAKQAMFRHLDKLKAGDNIYIFAFGSVLNYVVRDFEEIYPSENDRLAPVKDTDMITLLTCTPYLQNYNRLLVNAVRAENSFVEINSSKSITDTQDTEQPEINQIIESITETERVNPEVRRVKFTMHLVSAAGLLSWIVVFFMIIRLGLKNN